MTLFIVLLLLDLLLVRSVISDSGSWQLKLLAIVCACTLNFLTFSAFKTGEGWPTSSALPAQAQFLGCYVVEPSAIYIWAAPLQESRPLIGYANHPGEPRLWVVEYSRSLHEQCSQAEKAVQRGTAVGVGRRLPKGKLSPRGRFHFYKLPPPHFPDKVHRSQPNGG